MLSFPLGGTGGGERGRRAARLGRLSSRPLVSETDNSCKVCCRDPAGRCTPYVDAEQNNLFLRKGKPCTVGFCDMNVSIYVQLFFCTSEIGCFYIVNIGFCKWKETHTCCRVLPQRLFWCECLSGEVSVGTAYRQRPGALGRLKHSPGQGTLSPETGQDLGGLWQSWLVWDSGS